MAARAVPAPHRPPPPDRVEQLLAPHRAGLLHFLGAGLRAEVEDGAFAARTSSVPDADADARTLLRAPARERDQPLGGVG